MLGPEVLLLVKVSSDERESLLDLVGAGSSKSLGEREAINEAKGTVVKKRREGKMEDQR